MNTDKIIFPAIEMITKISSIKFKFEGKEKNSNRIIYGISQVSKEGNRYLLKFWSESIDYDLGFEYEYVKLMGGGLNLFLENFWFENISIQFSKDKNSDQSIGVGHITNFTTQKSINENEELYRRLIIPLKEKLSFTYTLKSVGFNYDNKKNSSGLLKVNINHKKFDFYFYSYKEKNYLVIDSLNVLTHNEFYSICYSIIISYGFITGKFPYSEGFYFKSDNIQFMNKMEFEYKTLTDSTSSNYVLIYSNIYGYHHLIKVNDLEKYKNCINEIDEILFSKISSEIFNDEYILRTISLLILANSYEIFSALPVYLLIIERIAHKLSNKSEISFEPESIIKKFQNFGLRLNDRDKSVLIKTKSFLLTDDIAPFHKSFYYAITMNGIISRFFLKYFGYSGKTYNYAKMYEDFTECPVEGEDYLIDV